jgi:hypothetical protein
MLQEIKADVKLNYEFREKRICQSTNMSAQTVAKSLKRTGK